MARSFYENDSPIANKPGTTQPLTPQQAQDDKPHGDVSLIDGMVIRTTPLLEQWTSKIRHSFNTKFQILEAELGTQSLALRNEWSSIKQEYHSIVNEPILPNGMYILTAFLTGSILARNRNIGVRFITPLLFGGVALDYFMPRTFANIVLRYEIAEKEKVPEWSKKRQETIKDLKDIRAGLNEERLKFNESVILQVSNWRKSFKEFFDENGKKQK